MKVLGDGRFIFSRGGGCDEIKRGTKKKKWHQNEDGGDTTKKGRVRGWYMGDKTVGKRAKEKFTGGELRE